MAVTWLLPTSSAATSARPFASAARPSPRPRSSTRPRLAPRPTGTPASWRHAQGSVRDAVPLAERALAAARRRTGRSQPRSAAHHPGHDAAAAGPAQSMRPSRTSRRPPRSCCGAALPVDIGRNELARPEPATSAGDIGRAQADEWSGPRDHSGRRAIRGCGREVSRRSGAAARGDGRGRDCVIPRGSLVLTGVGSDRGAASSGSSWPVCSRKSATSTRRATPTERGRCVGVAKSRPTVKKNQQARREHQTARVSRSQQHQLPLSRFAKFGALSGATATEVAPMLATIAAATAAMASLLRRAMSILPLTGGRLTSPVEDHRGAALPKSRS